MDLENELNGNEYTYSGYSRNTIIENKNFSIDYDKYIHFAFYVCFYISYIKKDRCLDTEVLIWYLNTFKQIIINQSKKTKITYFNLINNLIEDKCVKVIMENNKRYLTHNKNFILWGWKRRVLKIEKNEMNKYF